MNWPRCRAGVRQLPRAALPRASSFWATSKSPPSTTSPSIALARCGRQGIARASPSSRALPQRGSRLLRPPGASALPFELLQRSQCDESEQRNAIDRSQGAPKEGSPCRLEVRTLRAAAASARCSCAVAQQTHAWDGVPAMGTAHMGTPARQITGREGPTSAAALRKHPCCTTEVLFAGWRASTA